VPWLKGCVNDIQAMRTYLESRVASEEFTLHLRSLTNEQATRQAVINGFQQHLSQAGSEDVALFCYSGHGAQAEAPEAFWPVSPGRMMETLVCYDSRTDDDHWDLADKELNQLIAQVSRNEPHIVVVLDCCHSGSGTKSIEDQSIGELILTRRAQPDLRQRPLDSLIVSPADISTPANDGTRNVTRMPMALRLPVGRHVVLSACSNHEEAKEYAAAEEFRGAFSYFLQSSLAQANGALSYRDLFKRTNALVRSNVGAQSPQVEATHTEDLDQPFLGGAIAPSPSYFTLSHSPTHGWAIDGGAIHGLQSPADSESTVLAIFPFDASAQQLSDVSSAIAQVRISQVLPQLSKIDTGSDAIFSNPNTTFKAVVISSSLPPLSVFLTGDAAGTEALQRALATSAPNGQPSLYVHAIDQIEGANFQVLAQDDAYTIAAVTDQRTLVKPVSGYSAPSATKIVQNLEHIARWKTISELASPASSQIQGDISLKVYAGDTPSLETATEIPNPQIRLDYDYNAAKQTWTPPRFRLKLHNTSDQVLYCALFYLTERFKVDVLKPDGVSGLVRLESNQEIWFANGASINGTVADALWKQGITECQDILKLIACTDEFDPSLMTLGELGLPPAAMRSLFAPSASSLNRLMQRVATRDLSFDTAPQTYDDWVTNQIAFTFVRPQSAIAIGESTSVTLGSGVRVQPHPGLRADARLTTVAQSTRDLGNAVLPPLLQAYSEPLQFTQSRASDPGLSALELNNVKNLAAVTPENPLIVETATRMRDDEYVLPIAYDGEFYLPLGYGTTQNGKTQIVIERLTEPVSEGNRSVTGSIRIFFQKIITTKLGGKFEYPLLAAVDLENSEDFSNSSDSPEVVYVKDVEAVKARVVQAKNIAIYIHGIFGDTASMLPSLNSAVATLENDQTPIGQLYDLVLAFDYENLNTTIDRNARLLKERLEGVGLGAGHDKKIHMVAHSMGGLVSRWFIEREGGNEIVNHLIMLGTPNNGSPWPQVQAGMTAAVSFALNGLSLVAAPLKILEGLLKRIESVDVSLDQMEPGSEFLAELARSADPQVPYTLVVGNTSLVEPDAKAGLRQKLIQRLGKIVEIPFFNQPNDIAVLVDSITFVPEGRSPAPKILPTACNHLEYFSHPAGLESLTSAVVGTGIGSERPGIAQSEPVQSEPVQSEPVQPVLAPLVPPSAIAAPQTETSVGASPAVMLPKERLEPRTVAPAASNGGVSPVESSQSRKVEPALPNFAPLPVPENDEPSPFVSDRVGDEAVSNTRSNSKLWLGLAVGLAVLTGALFSLTQRPEPNTVEPNSTEQTE